MRQTSGLSMAILGIYYIIMILHVAVCSCLLQGGRIMTDSLLQAILHTSLVGGNGLSPEAIKHSNLRTELRSLVGAKLQYRPDRAKIASLMVRHAADASKRGFLFRRYTKGQFLSELSTVQTEVRVHVIINLNGNQLVFIMHGSRLRLAASTVLIGQPVRAS